MDAALEVEFLIAQVGFGLENLRSGLRFRRVGGEKFAFKIAESLCACSRSARFPAPVVASAENCSTRFFARWIRGVNAAFLAVALLS